MTKKSQEKDDVTIVYEAVALDKDTKPADIPNDNLQYDHAILHYRYSKMVHKDTKYKGWTKEDFVDYHALIVKEFRKRSIPHFPYNDELDEDSKKIEKQYMTVNPFGEKQGERIFLDEVLDYFDSFKMRHTYISLIGGLVVHGNTENDIDILIKDTKKIPEFYKHILEWRIMRGLPPELWDRVQFHYDEFHGPFIDHIPLYDMTLERINKKNNVINMSYDDVDLQKTYPPESQKSMILTMSEDKIEPGRFVAPITKFLGGKYGYVFGIDHTIEYMEKLTEKKGEFPELAVQEKLKGERIQVHKYENNVEIYDKFGNILDIKQKRDIEKYPEDFIIDAVLSKDDDVVFVDLLYFRGKDLHKENCSNRLEILTGNFLDFKKTIVHFDIVKNKEELENILSDDQNSKSLIFKFADGEYSLDGTTTDMFEYMKFVYANVMVTKVNETGAPGIFSYDVAVGMKAGEKIVPEQIAIIGDNKYAKVGRTYTTDIKLDIGDVLKVFPGEFAYNFDQEDGVYRLQLRDVVANEKVDKGELYSVTDILRIGKESGKLIGKSVSEMADMETIEKDIEENFKKAVDPFMMIPGEDKQNRYIVQNHFRGKSLHSDLRIEINKDNLVGWTLNTQMAGAINAPVENMKQARKMTGAKYSRVNWDTGQWAQDRGNNVEILSERKHIMPHEWIDVEGVVEPGEIGAAKNHPGVFHIVDKGNVEYLAQKPKFHEYYFDSSRGRGGLKGRYMFRQLGTEDIGKIDGEVIDKITIPAAETEFKDKKAWFFIKPEDQTPYVLSRRAVSKNWIPPYNVSALPKYIRKQIPEQYRYWNSKDEGKRKSVRNELFEAIKKDEVKVNIEKILNLSESDAKFSVHFEKTKKDVDGPIKASSVSWKYYLKLDIGKNYVMSWITENNPCEQSKLAGYYKRDNDKSSMYTGDIVDHGGCVVLVNEPMFKKIEFIGTDMKGVWSITRSDDGVWSIEKKINNKNN